MGIASLHRPFCDPLRPVCVGRTDRPGSTVSATHCSVEDDVSCGPGYECVVLLRSSVFFCPLVLRSGQTHLRPHLLPCRRPPPARKLCKSSLPTSQRKPNWQVPSRCPP